MKRPVVSLTRRQTESLLTLPEEAEFTRSDQRKIIGAAVKIWQNGKPPDPDRVIEVLKIPPRLKAKKSQLGQVVRVAQEIAKAVSANGKRPKLSLSKAQVFAAVRQLGPEEKGELLRLLKEEEQKVREDFGRAVERLRKAYAGVPPEEVARDVAQAVALVRKEGRAKRSPGH